MTERLLLLRSASTEQHFILGADHPSARVFEAATSSLVAVLKPSPRGGSALTTDTLTAVAIGTCDAAVGHCYAAAGLSNGTVLLHSVTANEPLAPALVSPTQQPVISIAICGNFMWCLTADGKVAVVALSKAEDGVCFQWACTPHASAITAVQVETADANETAFEVLVAGATTCTFRVTSAGAATNFRAEKKSSFASQCGEVTFAWLSAAASPQGRAAVTASQQDAAVRLWDVQSAADALGRSAAEAAGDHARCRRTLVCGQRIADVSVLEGRHRCFVSATTFTGAVLLWDLGATLLPAAPEPFPLPPHVVLHSSSAAGRLLLCRLLPFSGRDESREGLAALLLRGRFALPHFDRVVVGRLPATGRQRGRIAAPSSLALVGTGSASLLEVPLSSPAQRDALQLHERTLRRGAGAGGAAMDNVWRKQRAAAVATTARLTPTVAFPQPQAYQAASTAELPVRKQTLEQRLRAMSKAGAGAWVGAPAAETLGLATVPLYQALHAGDVAAVMELLSVASRSAEGMRATVTGLQLPYCLQLLAILSERLGICTRSGAQSGAVMGSGLAGVSARAPLLQWVGVIIEQRGMEMFEAQREYERGAGADDGAAAASPPAAFVAPILHHYRRLTSIHDSLAALHGRMGAFLGVRPSEKHRFVNRSRKMLSSNLDAGGAATTSGVLGSDIHFPAVFAEVASRRGNYCVRVRQKSVARRRAAKPAELLREAKERAARARDGEKRSFLDREGDGVLDDVIMEKIAEDGDINLEDLEGMGLESDTDVASGEDEEDEEESGGGKAPKRARVEADEMLAADRSEEDGSSSGDEEFSEGSAAVGTPAESAEESEEESDDDTEDEESELDAPEDVATDSSDDGLGEELEELLDDNENTNGSRQLSRDKRVNRNAPRVMQIYTQILNFLTIRRCGSDRR
eukprot:gene10482-7287_t